mmetsp:Transcript_22449/g.29369  ORF Transcript_22449/g.29369 Transcript_22449/m.29369 type:complete len:188 (+) Transcript_22449:195-758(+)
MEGENSSPPSNDDGSVFSNNSAQQLFDEGFFGIIGFCLKFLEDNGWLLVFILITVHILRSKTKPFFNRMRQQRSLREANDPQRRRILDVEAQRIRERQQAQHEEKIQKAKEEEAKKKAEEAKKKSEELEKKIADTFTRGRSSRSSTNPWSGGSSSSSGGGYNPLTGQGGNVSSYRPSYEMRRRGGGG